MYSNTAVRASAFVGHARRWMRSFLSEAWKLSCGELSKQSPHEPIETSMPTALHRRVNISDVYCLDSRGRRGAGRLADTTDRCRRRVRGVTVDISAPMLGVVAALFSLLAFVIIIA